MLTSSPHFQSGTNRTRRRVVLKSGLPARLFEQPLRYKNRDRLLSFGRLFIAHGSEWCQSILRTGNRIESGLLRQKSVLASLFSRSRATTEKIARVQVSSINRTRIILIKEDTPLPSTVSLKSEAFLPGWRIIKNLDRRALIREVAGADLKFSYLAGEIRATVFCRKDLGALRRAAQCVLARQEGQLFKFNSLEFTKVVSKRFLGIPVMSVTAHSGCIQRGFGLAAPTILSSECLPRRYHYSEVDKLQSAPPD